AGQSRKWILELMTWRWLLRPHLAFFNYRPDPFLCAAKEDKIADRLLTFAARPLSDPFRRIRGWWRVLFSGSHR
ncbi:MAG: hypothetical protein ACI9OD_000853, partial [Limisphaerales bacterium]